MSVQRIQDIDIKSKGLFVGLYGVNGQEFYIDSDLRKYNFYQQLSIYLKEEGFNKVIMYDAVNNFHSYFKTDLEQLKYSSKSSQKTKKRKSRVKNSIGRRRKSTVQSQTQENQNSSITFYPTGNSRNGFYRDQMNTRIRDYFETEINNSKAKTAFIIKDFNNLNIDQQDSYVALFREAQQNYIINNSQNKVLIIYDSISSESLIQKFHQNRGKLMYNKFFEEIFIKSNYDSNDLNINTTYKIEKPKTDEISNLIDYQRIAKRVTVDILNLDTICSSIEVKNYLLSKLIKKIDNINSIDIDTLIKSKIINAPFIEINEELIQSNMVKVKGQNNIAEVFTNKLKSHYSIPRENPLSFMLVGTSGVGKTYTGELLAEALGDNGFELARLNMTEYMSENNTYKLFGADPGHIGYDDKPVLFEKLESTNKLVILFDEIEKAHEKVITALMQLLDKGSMFWKNQEADFKDCIIVFTSNASRQDFTNAKREQIETGKSLLDNRFQNKLKDILSKSNSKFLPEFCGRINTFLIYDPLSREDIIEVAQESIPYYFEKTYSINIKNISKELIANLANDYKGSQFGLRDFKNNRKDLADELTRGFKAEPDKEYDIVKNDFGYQLVNTSLSNSNTIKEIVNLSKRFEKQSKVINREKLTKDFGMVKGQSDSILSIINTIDNWFISKEKPLSFFLVGPSGVGKTETFKVLHKALKKYNYGSHRIDCNLLSNESGITRIIGSEEGYVGANNEPEIFKKLRTSSEGKLVILFDEIEKADPKILVTLMGLLDEGRLSWNKGEGDFRRCIFFFTSNIAQRAFRNLKATLINNGLKNTDDDYQNKIANQLIFEFNKKGLGPEIVGRMNKILVYNPVNEEMIKATSKGIINSESLKRKLSVEYMDDAIIEYLIKQYNGNEMGVRPIKNLLIDNINREYRRIFLEIDEDKNTPVKILNDIENENLLRIQVL